MAKEFRIYRANKQNNGVAVSFQLSYKENEPFDKYMLFMTVAKQIPSNTENASFSWKDGAINVKLGENDINSMLAVLLGFQQEVGYKGSMFHQTPNNKGNKVIKFSSGESGISLNVSMQDAEGKKTGPYSLVLSHGEGICLRVLLEQALLRFFDW